MDQVAELLDRHKAIRACVDPYLAYWQELAEIYMPDQAFFTRGVQEGERQYEDIYDGAPRLAARDLAAAIDSLLKSKTSHWFGIESEDEELNEIEGVKLWFELVRERMWRAVYNPAARFIQRSSETDKALTVLGHGFLWLGERSDRSGLLFKTYHARDVGFEENADGEIDTVALDEYLTGQQAVKRWGRDRVHPDIVKAAAENKGTKFRFAQLVLPRADYDGERLGPSGMPFRTVVLDVKHEVMVPGTEGGFREFPAAIPRWDTQPGSAFGRSVGMLALPDSLTLQAMGKTLLVGGERAIDPPALIPSDVMVSALRTFPGGLSTFDPQAMTDAGLNTPIFPWPVATQLPVGREMQYDYRQQVEAAFFKNVMRLPLEGRQMTATEILERKEEFIRVLGPTFGRLEPEYLGTTIGRVFGIMQRAGAFPEPPDELADAPVKFTFQSPIQQARKAIEAAGFSRSLELTAPLGQIQPEIYDNLDGDAIMRDMPEAFGMPSRWLRPVKQVEEIREQRAEQQATEATVASAPPVAGAIKDVAAAQADLANVGV